MSRACSRRALLGALGAAGAVIAAPGLARTSWRIRGAGRGALRLVFYTDIHAGAEPPGSDALGMAAAAINAQEPDLVLCGGDLIAGGFDARADAVAPRWDAYTGMARAIEAEHHAVIGNHDLVGARPADGSPPAADPRSEFRRHLGVGRTYDTFDALGYRFVLLDSLRISDAPHMYDGWVSAEQRGWLRGLLSRTPRDQPLVVVLHMPLLTAFFAATEGGTAPAPRNRVVINNTEVLALFADHNLVLVLQGHLHVSEAVQWRGTTFLTGGAICGSWWHGSYHGTAEGFSAITLTEDRLDWDYVDYGWHASKHAQ